MKKCKECGREEWGFLSVLNEDGYCQRCATIHYEEKIKKLQEQLDIAKTGIEFVKDVLVENKDSDVLWDMVNGYLKATLDKIDGVK